MHICGSQLLHSSDPLIWSQISVVRQQTENPSTLNACCVFLLKESHQQMSGLLYCGTWWQCVGFREQAVVTSFCWLHSLLPLPPTDVTVRGSVGRAVPRWSISEFRAVTSSFGLSLDVAVTAINKRTIMSVTPQSVVDHFQFTAFNRNEHQWLVHLGPSPVTSFII